MSIFDQDLSFEEALGIDSLLDSGGISPEMFLMTEEGQKLFPNRDTTQTVMEYLDTQHTISPENSVQPTEENKTSTEEQQKKNPKRQYIKLEDATISKRSANKSKHSKTKGYNESK